MSGSRLPVGSSAMISRGSWTSARAMAVRCCSPPDSCDGRLLRLRGQADERQHPVDRRSDLAARRAGHLERERHVLPDRLGRQQLEVLEDDADLAPHLGHLPSPEPGDILAVEDDLATGRELVADQQLDERRLARARRTDEEDEVALGDDEVDVAQGELAVRVRLRDVVQDEDGPFLLGVVAASGRGRGVGWSARRSGLGRRSHSAPRARLAAAVAARHRAARLRPRARPGEPHREPRLPPGPGSGKRDQWCATAPDHRQVSAHRRPGEIGR